MIRGVAPLIAMAILFGLGAWIIAPIHRAEQRFKLPARYSIVDILCLFVGQQVPLGVILWMNAKTVYLDEWLLRIIAGVACIAGIGIWWVATRIISRCGIYRGWRRIVFLCIVTPTVYYALIPFSILIPMGLIIVEQDPASLLTDHRGAVWWTAFLGCALLICGVLNRKIVAGVECDPEPLAQPSSKLDR